MRIIPVIDLKQRLVVRGIGGRRDKYRRIVSRLVASAQPADIAKSFVEQLGLRTVYVADLDAIAGAEPDWQSYAQIAAAGMTLWVDAGAGDVERAAKVADCPHVDSVIVGLESLIDIDALQHIIARLSSARVIFSLDLKQGEPLTRIANWRTRAPLDIARQAAALGAARMIVLDLAAVGTGEGPSTLQLARDIRQALPQLELIGGGGVRHQDDLDRLAEVGYDAALIASALHAGVRFRA